MFPFLPAPGADDDGKVAPLHNSLEMLTRSVRIRVRDHSGGLPQSLGVELHPYS